MSSNNTGPDMPNQPGGAALQQLIEKARRGDRQALARVLEKYLPSAAALLASRAYGISAREVLDDLVQETALRVVAGIGGLRRPDYARTWICSIALNVLQTHRRKTYRRRKVEVEPASDRHLETVADPPGVVTEAGPLENEISKLPDTLREVLYMKYTAGMRYREISDALNISPHTVKARLHEARRRLRKKLEDPDDG